MLHSIKMLDSLPGFVDDSRRNRAEDRSRVSVSCFRFKTWNGSKLLISFCPHRLTILVRILSVFNTHSLPKSMRG